MRRIHILSLLLGLAATPLYAQTLGFDLEPGNPVFSATGTVVDPDSNIDATKTVNNGEQFSTLIRLNGVENLLGVGFDFTFDNSVLNVVDISETRMDLDFSGQQDFAELDVALHFFLVIVEPIPFGVDTITYTYDDGTGMITTHPGILIDFDGDNDLSFVEMASYIIQFIDEFEGNDIPFWTEVVSRRIGPGESVEVFDYVSNINANGEATDNAMVLLPREGTATTGFGFDGNAILLEVVFQAVGSGTSDITLNATGSPGGAYWTDEGFAEALSEIHYFDPSEVVVSTVTVE